MDVTDALLGLLVLLYEGGRAFSRPIRGIMDMRPLGGRLGIPDAAAAADEGSILGRRLLRGTSREEGTPASVMRRGLREVLGVFMLVAFSFYGMY